ncbi:MAG: glycosyltransferase [Cytophagales bacterium]|nr:glycosyltransferase [Cytophagales bacterium]
MLSIIIPSFKGSTVLKNQLPGFIKYLENKKINYEIIIVDDGSKDGGKTQQIAKDFGCLYFENKKNMGKGAAVKLGMLNAKGDFRIYTDVDIPFEYSAIERFLYYLDFKEFDLAIGDRTLPESTYFSEIPAIRRIGSAIFTFIIGRFITTGMFDTQCGLKGFRGNVAEDLFSVSRINGFAFDAELLYVSLKRNYDIKRLPVKFRNQEGSSVSYLIHGIEILKDLVLLKINHLTGKYKKK